jgi:hypothetical protein
LATGRTAAADVLSDVIHELRDRVEHHAGVFAPTNPRSRPADPGTADLLRTTHRLEQEINTRIQRHAITADHATRWYAQYRPHTSHDLARAAAIHDAYLTTRPDPPTDGQPPGPGPDTQMSAEAATSTAARDFPTTAHDATTAGDGPPGSTSPPPLSTPETKRATR